LTNQIVRELIERRWIDCSRPGPGVQAPAKYRLTPAGRRHQTHVSRLRMSSLVEASRAVSPPPGPPVGDVLDLSWM
jgi:hypothetical protein